MKLDALVVAEKFSPEIMSYTEGRRGVKEKEQTLHYWGGDVGAKEGCTLQTLHTAHCTLFTLLTRHALHTAHTAHLEQGTYHALYTLKTSQ